MNHERDIVTNRIRPRWIEDLTTFYRGRITRQFVLHFNINDFIIDLTEKRELGNSEYIRTGEFVADSDHLYTMREYLHQFLFHGLKCQAIYTYSLAGGLIANDKQQIGMDPPLVRELRGLATQRLYDASKILIPVSRERRQPAEGQEVNLPDNIAENFKLLGYILRQQHYEKPDTSSTNQGRNEREAPIAVILDYAEKLIPYQLDEGHGDREQLQALEIIQRWAIDPLIRRTNNIIILLTINIGRIPSSVYAESSGCRAIRIPLPDKYEREAFIQYKMTKAPVRFVKLDAVFGSKEREQASNLAHITQGMRLIDIDNVSRRAIIEGLMHNRNIPNFDPIMKVDDVQRAKAEFIQAQSEQLLEIVLPTRSFNEIGGLSNLKQYLKTRSALMLKGINSPLVPSGLLLAGPPGTGKTIIAEALATEAHFNLVKMRNVQDKWIGSSERNLELVINLLKDLHPVVVFIDEIDQALVRRDTGQSGDSGVGARMFARILEEMGNTSNRGRILWVAATNRADIIDPALLRRFDRVIPLLVPGVEESCRIFASMINSIIKQSGNSIIVAYGEDLRQSVNRDEEGRPAPTREDLEKFLIVAEKTVELGLTGAAIEIVVHRAIEIAYEDIMDSRQEPTQRDIPLVGSRHLLAAIDDYKPNHNRLVYDHQALLAIRACNFHSVIPPLPKSGVFTRIQKEHGRIDPEQLEMAIFEIEHRLRDSRYI